MYWRCSRNVQQRDGKAGVVKWMVVVVMMMLKSEDVEGKSSSRNGGGRVGRLRCCLRVR